MKSFHNADTGRKERLRQLQIDSRRVIRQGVAFSFLHRAITDEQEVATTVVSPAEKRGRDFDRIEHAIAAGSAIGNAQESEASNLQNLGLQIVAGSDGNRWLGNVHAEDTWASLHAEVALRLNIDGCFAAIVVSGSEPRLNDLMFEAVALGPGETPDFNREIGRPQPAGAAIPIVMGQGFRLNRPLHVALYVSDGHALLGCLIFQLSKK